MSTLTATQLQQQYIAYFGRPGDPAGIKYWLSSSSGISSAREFADKIYAQDEYKKSTVGAKSTEAQVNSLYQNLFGREADATGLIYWTGQIEAGTLTLSNIAYDLIAAASNPVSGNETQGAADALALSNKVAAAEAFTADVEASTSAILAYQPETSTPWVTGAAFESGKTYLAGITTTAHTASGIDSAVSTMIAANTTSGSTAASSTAKFTTSQDVLSGGNGNDIFNGVVIAQAGTGTTISPGDTVDGGSGTDTVNISFSGAHSGAYTLEAVDLDKVEKVLVSNYETSGNGTTVSGSLFDSSLTTVGLSSSASTGVTTFSNLMQQVTAEMRNGAADLTLSYETAVLKGTADVQALTVQGLTAGTFTANGAETITIATELTKSTLTDVAGTGLKTIKVTGDQALTVSTALTEKTIDASGNSGGVTVTLGTADQTVTGGSGDDVIDGVGVVTLADTIDGGAGTDTLKLEVGASTIDGTALTGEISKVSNIEKIEIESTNDSATLELNNTSGVTTVIADSNTKTLTVNLGANSTDTTVATVAVVDGTSFTTAELDLHSGGGNQAADEEDIADALSALITANANYTATNAAGVITIVSALEEELDVAITAAKDSNSVTVSGTASDYQNVSFTKASDQVVDVFRAGNVTYNKNDASGLTDSVTFNLKSHEDNKALDQTITDLTFTEIETATITTSGLDSDKGYTLSALSADSKLTTLNISGANNLTITDHGSDNSKLATIDASAFTGDLTLSDARSSLAQTITSGSGNDTVVFAGNLTDADVIDLGGNTALTDGTAGKDKVTATGDIGTSVKDSVLQLANVETFELVDTGSAATYIDASKITGTQNLAFSNTAGTVKIKNLGASATIGIGVGVAEFGETSSTTLDVALADETGTSDSITLDMSDSTNTANELTLKSTGIETLNVKATKESGNNVTDVITFGDNAPSKIVITDGHSGDTLSLGTTLNKTTTDVDASAFKGILSLSGASGVGMTVSAGATVNNSITTSTGADTVTLVGDLGNTDNTIALGTGTDVLNATLSATDTDSQLFSGIETLNFTIKDSTSAGFDNATAEDGALHTATTINILGGNALSKFVMTGATIDDSAIAQTIDSSTFAGAVELNFAADALDANVTVKGGVSSDDQITVLLGTDQKAASVTGIEKLVVTVTNNDDDGDIDLANFTGLTEISATFNGNAGDQIELNDIPTSVTNIKVTSASTEDADADNLVLDMVNAADSDTSAKIEMTAAFAATNDLINIDGAGLETLTIDNKAGASTNQFDLAGVTATTGSTSSLTLTGNGGTLVTLSDSFDTIDASGSTGGLIVTAANRPSTIMTITGSTGNDTISMENKGDVLNGGAGTGDTLNINANGVLGGFAIDLTSTTDQVTSFGGVANPALQTGFEHVDFSAVTGDFGGDVTGTDLANTITTNGKNSNVDGGKGNDSITGGAGADVLNGGAGNDIIGGGGGADTLTGGAGDDSITGAAGVDTIDGGAGVDTIDGAGGKDVITPGAGADIIDGGTGADTIALGNDGDVDHVNMAESEGIAASATNLADGAASDGKTITYGNGVDVITGFTGGTGGDVIDGLNGSLLPTAIGGLTNGGSITNNQSLYSYGSFNSSTNVFTFETDGFDATYNDAWVAYSINADAAGVSGATHVVILQDLTIALSAANFV